MTEKPFPWKCPKCHQKAVRKVVRDYAGNIEHDGREYAITIPSIEIACCENCDTIVLTDSVNDAIDQALRHEAGLLTPVQIKRNREALGLTQKELATRLAISDATLCRWETGAQIQQRSLDRWMRTFFSDERIRQITKDENQMAELGTTVRY